MATIPSFSDYFKRLKQLLLSCDTSEKLFPIIVNAPFYHKFHSTNFDLGMIVLTLYNPETKLIDRIGHSDTAPANDAVKASPLPFRNIKIPIYSRVNIIAKAIRSQSPQKTSDWKYLLAPAIPADAARFNQAESGMGCSFVYPFKAHNGGALTFSFYQPIDMIGDCHKSFMKDYTALVNDILASKQL